MMPNRLSTFLREVIAYSPYVIHDLIYAAICRHHDKAATKEYAAINAMYRSNTLAAKQEGKADA